MNPIYFRDNIEFRKWLRKNHQTESEVQVGYYKVNSGKPSITWSQSVDEALCYGWIDGIRRSIDNERYTIRFTPRKPTSIWSQVNIRKAEELIKKRLMKKSGIDAFSKRKKSQSGIYSFENLQAILPDTFEDLFRANTEAWEFFCKQAPSYKKTIVYWITSAKQEITRIRRLNKTILESAKHRKIF